MNQVWFQPALRPEGGTALSPRERAIRVPGGQGCVFAVSAGDALRITDPEGLQSGLLYALAGTFAPVEAGQAPDLAALLDGIGGGAAARTALAAGGIGPSDLAGLVILDGETTAGAAWEGIAARDSLCLLAAPGAAMAPEAQNPPTELHLAIRPKASIVGQAPPPLAPPLQDLRVTAATARAYTVKAGQYIQIIDVDGRQCADFLAFDAAELAQGREFGLDATTTHTLMGTSSPKPGLHAKYFDARMVPLVEVVQDTVGRHDTFMLACSAKYYEDMGYPGHSNCTDNFNAVLAPHGIDARKGWPAINFFYNTIPGTNDRIDMDEPWSRPGDYVLLRALTDLVCATSSCADDIDPANGWCPTDIHVRVYDAACAFPHGMSHRMTPDSEPRLTRETGFHPRTAALTRKIEDYRGFWLPSCFSSAGPIEEYWACRERAVVLDLSALRKFEVIGPDAEALMQLALTRDVRKLAVGQVVYAAMCYEHGGMIDDGTLFRLGPNNFRWICGDAYVGLWLRQLGAQNGLKAWVKDSTDQLHNLSVQGPRARDILAPLLVTPPHQPSLSELKWFRFTVGRLAGVPVVVSRTGYTGELGYEVWCHPSQAVAVWDAIMEAGAPHGLTPAGLAALDMLRIEAGLVFAEYEFCDQTDPFEAGIGFAVAAAKADPYIGKEALDRRRASPHRRLVGLDIAGNEAVGHGDPVYAGRAQVGVVTSAVKSPILRKTIALARLDIAAAKNGGAVEIGKLDGHQKRLAATIVPFPHYDPEKTRVRAEAAPVAAPPPASASDTVATAGIPT
ncbi:MAG TPA: aminomethyltransferase family protein [Methylorubrum populi]|uniref:Aminomethyltransferase family protein n=1 Tax=Methylorubrum populi TaxID=223967 RepID=A0A921E1U8_9HYPH|nr:aminomethyltransferase family protein [Methylorubrum populi]